MKLIVLLLFLLHPTVLVTSKTEGIDAAADLSLQNRNILVNILLDKLIAYIRHVITQGSSIFGIPILDPLEIENFHLVIPTGLFNFDLRFKNISVIGFGGFLLHRNILHLSNLSFEIEMSLPRVTLSAETMHISEIDNDFTSSIPVMYKDKTELKMDNFRLEAYLQLKQSDDEKSILIDKIEKAFFDIPTFKINSNGIIDSENLEMFSDLEDGLVDYLNSRKEAIINFISQAILTFGNPILNRLDTWRYISILL